MTDASGITPASDEVVAEPCLYCRRGHHHLCDGERRCGCGHSVKDVLASNEKFHAASPAAAASVAERERDAALARERETMAAFRRSEASRGAALARVEWLEETLRDYANRANWGKGVGVPEKLHQLPARIWKPDEDGYARAIRVLASPAGTTEGE